MPRNRAKRHEVKTGLRWDNIVKALQTESWEVDEHDDTQEIRRVWLGSRMGLSPSGKMYMPWATSNLNPCPACDGTGEVTLSLPTRRMKKARRRLDALDVKGARIMRQCRTAGNAWTGIRRFNMNYANTLRETLEPLATGKRQCLRCDGCGSHEARDDERFWELVEKEADSHDVFIDSNEDGDMVYAAEVRPSESEDDDESEE